MLRLIPLAIIAAGFFALWQCAANETVAARTDAAMAPTFALGTAFSADPIKRGSAGRMSRHEVADADHGDVVIVRYHGHERVLRLIAEPGERIAIEHGVVLSNGKPYEQVTDQSGTTREGSGENAYLVRPDPARSLQFGPRLLQANECFVLGDNRVGLEAGALERGEDAVGVVSCDAVYPVRAP